MRTVQLLSVAACLLLGQAHAEQVMVAVAANFSAASEVLEAEFEAASGHSVETALGYADRALIHQNRSKNEVRHKGA